MKRTMRCTAAGDMMIFRRLPGRYPGFDELSRFIGQGDLRFVNLETTVHRFESFGAAQSGGSWFCSAPEVLEDVKAFGFNILTTANNHAMDYSYGGLKKTMENLRRAGIPFAGTGDTLAEASGPVYLDTPSGRFALIAGCTTFHPDAPAGEQTRSMPGRPGMNAIRHTVTYRLPRKEMDCLRRIAEGTAINGEDDVLRREGYLPPLKEGTFRFGTLEFEEADAPGKVTRVNEEDMRRTERTIREAAYMADRVIVSIHSHELRTVRKEEPAGFLEEFAHRCIDAGAHAVIGTGPHLLRPVEIYRGRPIFYSIGDFVIQLETIQRAPSEMFEKQRLDGNETLDRLFEERSGGGKRGLYYNRLMFEAVVPYWETEDGELTKLTLLPVELGFGLPRSRGGWPAPRRDAGILERLAEMSAPYGTRIEIEDGLGVVRL